MKPKSGLVTKESVRSAGAMRVVVLDPDPEIRKILHGTIGEWPEFLLAGESRTWKECKALLDIYLPELLIVLCPSDCLLDVHRLSLVLPNRVAWDEHKGWRISCK